MRSLHDRIHKPNNPEISALNDQGRYLEAAQALADHSSVLTNNFFRLFFCVQKVVGPVLLIPCIAYGCIVITNFDDAIEEVFKHEGLLSMATCTEHSSTISFRVLFVVCVVFSFFLVLLLFLCCS